MAPSDESACQAAGALARATSARPDDSPDARDWTEIERRLGWADRPRRPRRAALVAAAAIAGVGLAAIVIWRRGSPPRPAAVASADAVDWARPLTAPADRDAVVRAPDGTTLRLVRGGAARLGPPPSPRARGELAVDDGTVEVTLADGSARPWTVRAGPFEAALDPGTRAVLSWSSVYRRVEASVLRGRVVVAGGAAGALVTLAAGQRFAATATAAAAPAVPAPPPTPRPLEPPPDATEGVRRRAAPPRAAKPSAPAPAAGDGGAACTAARARWTFDQGTSGFQPLKALRALSVARERSWCGAGSLRADASFTLDGPRDERNLLPFQTGHVAVRFKHPIDLTNRTVTVHLFVDADPAVRFGAGFYARSGDKKANSPWVHVQSPGRWVTLRHTYAPENRVWEGGTTRVNAVSELGISVWAEGTVRVFAGRVYVDEVDIR
jgi:hypothetical protein